jgi:sugar lactone lactonase YvrE
VTTGSGATFTVAANGVAPLSYQWQKNGVNIVSATMASYSIASAQATDAGSYTVMVTNSIGSVTSSAATLTVSAVAVAPAITTQPQSATTTVGSSVSFSVIATGTAPLGYQWQNSGTMITGATNSSYTIPSPQLSDSGQFTVIVSNSAGSVTSSAATLTVNPVLVAPVITTQPTSETVGTGHNISFSIAANSSLMTSYQWSVSTDGGATWTPLQDNANYAGTTSSTLTVKNATSTMSGYLYRCAVGNSAGSVNSSALTLSVAAAIFPSPTGVAISSTGVIYVSDSSNNTIQTVNTSWQAAAFVGTTGQQGANDGAGAAALFRQPGGVALDSSGNLYVADTGNSIIRRITPAGVVTTIAGSASSQGYRDGVGTAAWFNSPAAVALDSAGNLYVADAGNAVIRKIASDGTVSTFAGSDGATGSADGSGPNARFNQPSGIAVDGAGNLYVADTLNQTIRKITPAGLVSTLAGVAGISGSTDGSGTGALFSQPRGLAVDSLGSIYVADTANSAIRKISSTGVVTTVAGLSTVAGLLDGTGIGAWLNQPRDVKIDSAGNLIVADTGNAAIRKITPADVVTTPAIAAAATTSPSPPTGTTGSGSTTAEAPPGKSGGGLVESWFVMELIAIAAARRVLGRR